MQMYSNLNAVLFVHGVIMHSFLFFICNAYILLSLPHELVCF